MEEQSQAKGDTTRALPHDGGSIPREETAAFLPGQPPPLKKLGRYEVLDPIGSGGMGHVYKAFDPELRRTVALKILRDDDAGMLQRFVQEACVQARVEHEHICRVYEAGTIEDGETGQQRRCIAMQYIEGRTLGAAAAEMTLEQKLGVMCDVAEAVHAAHKIGLIHRDLKPSNIMVERTEQGWTPYVMDFGIAKELDATGLTLTGMVLGTPHYMAPEQARGETSKLDRRTDVYSLGATFYELLVGHPPFAGGSNIAVIMRTLEEDPPAMRSVVLTIPIELDAIVLKCLEKDPQRRYGSARALAEDLQRYRDGEPVLARHQTAIYRLLKKARKHKVIVSVSAAALAAVLLFAGMWIQARRTAALQVRVAREFSQEAEHIESIMAQAQLLPLHDTAQERRVVERMMGSIEDRMGEAGRNGFGPGHHAIGRGYMALGDYRAAERHLEKAWNEGRYHEPVLAQAMGVTYAMRYQEEMADAGRIANREMRLSRMAAIEKEYREAAIEFVNRGREAAGETHGYVEALLAYLKKDYPAALKRAEAAAAEAPWEYKADKLIGDIHGALAAERRDRGDVTAAQEAYAFAESAYRRCIEKGRSDSAVYEGLADIIVSRIQMLISSTGESPVEYFDRAREACRAAQKANPLSGSAYRLEAVILSRLSDYQLRHGGDARTPADEAIAAAKRAVELRPKDESAYRALADAYHYRSVYERERGEDPRGSMEKAIENNRRAVTINPNYALGHGSLGNACLQLALLEKERGTDPRPSLERAVEAYRKAVEIEPEFYTGYGNMGVAFVERGVYEGEVGVDPSESVRRGIESYRHAVSINPSYSQAIGNLGTAYLLMAQRERSQGKNPTRSLGQAREFCGRSIELNPNNIIALENMATSHRIQARYDLATGTDPTPSLDRAEETLQRALAIEPDDAYLQTAKGEIDWARAEYELQQQRSPLASVDRARKALRRALSIDPDHAQAWVALGDVEKVAAEWRLQEGASPAAELAAARSAFNQALQINPNDAAVYLGLGNALGLQAEWLLASKSPAGVGDLAGKMIEMSQKALAIVPGSADAISLRGSAELFRAKIESAPDARKELARRAVASYEEALKINPLLKRACERDRLEARRLAGL